MFEVVENSAEFSKCYKCGDYLRIAKVKCKITHKNGKSVMGKIPVQACPCGMYLWDSASDEMYVWYLKKLENE